MVAVGETGLDYYWDTVAPEVQHEHFRRHLAMAEAVGKPVMIHDREAHADVLRIVAEQGAPSAGVIFHAFSGDAAMARVCRAAGYVLSFAGVVTFSNAPGLRAGAAGDGRGRHPRRDRFAVPDPTSVPRTAELSISSAVDRSISGRRHATALRSQ